MTSQSDKTGDQVRSSFAPEFSGGTAWMVTMDDGQRKAHAMQMEANAHKTQAEADEIRGRNRLNQLRVVLSYFGVFLAIFGLGLACGAVFL